MKHFFASFVFRLIVMGIAFLLIALGYNVYLSFFHQDPLTIGIPPKENSDGTIDYTLVAQWKYDKEPYYWVVRLPKDQQVTSSENWSGNYSGGGISTGLRTRKNEYIKLYFRDSRLTQYYTWSEYKAAKNFRDTIDVNLQAGEWGPFAYLSMDERTLYEVVRKCDPIESVAPGVDLYPNIIVAPDAEKNGQACKAVNFDDRSRRPIYLVVRNAKGKAVGDFTCVPPDENSAGGCSGTYFVGSARVAFVSVPHALQPQLAILHESLEEFLGRVSVRADLSESRKTYLEKRRSHPELYPPDKYQQD